MYLNSVSACCRFTDESQTKLSLEEAFDFDIVLEEDEAKNTGMDVLKGTGYHVCLRVNVAGEIEEAEFCYDIKGSDNILALPIFDENEDAVNDIADFFAVCDIASCVDKELFMEYMRAISKRQNDKELMIFLGGYYDSNLQEYNGYHLTVCKYGVCMIEKFVNLSNDNEGGIWVLHPEATDAPPKSEFKRQALMIKHEHNIIDSTDNEFERKEYLYSLTDEAKEEGIEQIREMMGELRKPLYTMFADLPEKPITRNIINNICDHLKPNKKDS